jgi:hypothetical protein
MILVEAGEDGPEAFEAKVLFAGALAAAGHRALIDDRTLPPDIPSDWRYEAAPYLCDLQGQAPDRMILIGAERIDGFRPTALRGAAPSLRHVGLIGRFADRHERSVAVARIAHATGREPAVVDLTDLQPHTWPVATALPLFAAGAKGKDPAAPVSLRVLLALSPDLVDDPAQRAGIAAIAQSPRVRLRVMLPHWATDQAEFLSALGLAVYRDTEVSPAAFAAEADAVAFAGTSPFTQRAAAVGVAALASGAVLLDLTPEASLCAAGVPALRASPDILSLGPYIDVTLIGNFARVVEMSGRSAWTRAAAFPRLEQLFGTPTAPGGDSGGPRDSRVWFLPTNGVGLGHARRSVRISGLLPDTARVAFLAHSSCARLLAQTGRPVLDLVSRSHDHQESNATDVVNYLRLARLLRRGDLLVFDGNQIFDSVMRALGETSARLVWVRRGLWQPGQATVGLLAREKAAVRIIVPGEVFDELNTPLTWGPKISAVGPVVDSLPASFDRKAIRDRLSAATGIGFDRLIVSMLGGARPAPADRMAVSRYLCHRAERMPDTLHLVLTWPGSVVDRGLYGWRNSRVVHTLRAPDVAAAADTVISASGYNSFHEALYNRVPTIFVPQMAPYMDDQLARAKAAAKRGLAEVVKADDLLSLGRTLDAFLDGKARDIRAALSAFTLPATGTADAANIIWAEATA